jgi:hypothetical protein
VSRKINHFAWPGLGRTYGFAELSLERKVFKILYWYRKAALAKFGVERLSTFVREAKNAVFDGSADIMVHNAVPESFFWAHLECKRTLTRMRLASKCLQKMRVLRQSE